MLAHWYTLLMLGEPGPPPDTSGPREFVRRASRICLRVDGASAIAQQFAGASAITTTITATSAIDIEDDPP